MYIFQTNVDCILNIFIYNINKYEFEYKYIHKYFLNIVMHNKYTQYTHYIM